MCWTGDSSLFNSLISKTASKTYFKLTKLSDDFFYPVTYSLFTATQEARTEEFPRPASSICQEQVLELGQADEQAARQMGENVLALKQVCAQAKGCRAHLSHSPQTLLPVKSLALWSNPQVLICSSNFVQLCVHWQREKDLS